MQRVLLALFLVFIPLAAGAGGDSVSQSSLFWPTSGVGDGSATGYSSDQWQWLSRLLWLNDPTTQGVSKGFLNELAVSNPAGVTLRTASGGAIVYGFPYRNTANIDLWLTTPIIDTTGWRLVLRASWETQTVRIVLLQSVDGFIGIPALTQTAGVTWDLPLAQGFISVVPAVTIGDNRAFFEPGIEIDNGHLSSRTRRISVAPDVARNQTDGTNVFRETRGGISFPDLKRLRTAGWFAVPADYVGDLVITAVVSSTSAGVIYAQHYAQWQECGGTTGLDHITIAFAQYPVAILEVRCIAPIAIPDTDLDTGDLVDLEFVRDAADVLDTTGASLQFHGWYIDYTADM